MGCIVADLATRHQAAVAAAVVLIVEDDADMGSLLAELLTDEGYAVALLRSRSAESVQEAVGAAPPDCVLLLDGAIPRAASTGRGMTPPGSQRRRRLSR